MRVYHGSLEIVRHPVILLPNRKLDYSEGFYTTTSEKLKTLLFSVPSKEWVEFVMANRTRRGFTHDYDIVYGPVANDRVYLQFGLYESGAIGVDTLINELKTYKLVDQYLFHTEKALESLKFIDSIIIRK